MKKLMMCFIAASCLSLVGLADEISRCTGLTGAENLPDFPALESSQSRASTPLEERIRDFELQQQNYGRATAPGDSILLRIKLELAELYSQRPRERISLDDGADACPAPDLPGNIQPYTDFGTTIGAANNYNPISPCGTTYAPDKIYRFIPASSGFYTFDTFGSDFDTQLYINTGGACPGNTQVACNDDYGGSQSKVQYLMNAGQAYYIIVDGFQGYSGNFVLHLTTECSVGNGATWQQECAEAAGDPSHAVWDCNGGCNNQWYGGFPQWQAINLCQWVKGNSFTYQDPNNVSIRDIDSYYFTLTEPCIVQVSIYATFSFNLLINDYGYCLPNNHLMILNIPACYGGTATTACLPAGTYSVEISPNFYSGMTDPHGYYFAVQPSPCSGCRIDGNVVAPASFIANGCAGSDNSLRPSDEATYCVIIPYASDWTFSVCNSGIAWDSYLYLTSECDGGIIAQNNDGCSPGGHAKIECVPLQPGNYYITIEGNNAGDCNQFYMFITECAGSCCYGDDPYNLQCSYGSLTSCNVLGGEFTLGQSCAPEVCGIRPQCEDGSQFSQLPHLPTESWTAVASDVYPEYSLWEDYSVSGPISSVRFWGLFTDYSNGLPCFTQPETFQITFVDSANGPAVQTFSGTANGYLMPQNYGANFPVYQYDFDLPTNCNILSGRVSVQATVNDFCVFAWVTSPQGNGSVILVNPGGTVSLPLDMAICIERGCGAPDSVVIRWAAVNTNEIWFHVPQPSYVRVYYTTNVNAVFPATYSELTAGSFPAGTWSITDGTADAQRRYVLTAQCGPPPIAIEESSTPSHNRD